MKLSSPAQEIIGRESLVELPTSAIWSAVVNFRPGNGEVVNVNPPTFSWLYDLAVFKNYIGLRSFQFQVAYNEADFYNVSELAVNILTDSNMYNFLAPFNRSRMNSESKMFWRIGYIEAGDSVPSVWSPISIFIINNSAREWDRSMLANDSYLAQKSVHPHMLFNESNREQMYNYLEWLRTEFYIKNNNTDLSKFELGEDWKNVLISANASRSNIWWNLIGYWSFNNVDNAGFDSWVDRPLILYGNASINNSYTIFGNSLTLAGNGDYVRLSQNFSLLNNFTFSFWIRINDSVNSDLPIWSSVDNANQIIIQPRGIDAKFNGASHTVISTPSNIGKWIYLTITKQGSNVNLYRNGVFIGTVSFQNDFEINFSSSFLGYSEGYTNFKGNIDEVLIYNRALNVNEIESLYPDRLFYGIRPTIRLNFNNRTNSGFDSILEESNAVLNGNAKIVDGGRFGLAASFEETGDYITLGSVSSLTNFSIEGWLKLNNTSNASIPVWSKDSDYININPQGGIEVRFNGVQKNFVSVSNNNIWVYMAVTKNGSNINVYRNAVLMGTINTGDFSINFSSSYLGRNKNGNLFYVGLMDDICIYNRTLSSVEIYNLYSGKVGVWSPIPSNRMIRFDTLTGTAFVWQMTQDPKYLDNGRLQELLSDTADYFIASGQGLSDKINGGGGGATELALAYDWLYNVMTPEQRQHVIRAISLHCKRWLMTNTFASPPANGVDDPKNGVYALPRRLSGGEIIGTGESHMWEDNFLDTIIAAMATYNEDIEAKKFLYLGLNAMLGRPHYMGSEEGLDVGQYDFLDMKFLLERYIWAQNLFPEVKFNTNPWLYRVSEWFMRMNPVGTEAEFYMWGDPSLYGGTKSGLLRWGEALAWFINDGRMLQHVTEQRKVYQKSFDEVAFYAQVGRMFYFSKPNESITLTPNSQIFPLGGYAFASSSSPNTAEAFINGTGFIFASRAGDTGGRGHDANFDLSFELWAYGQTITENGASHWKWNGQPQSHNSLIVDGTGILQNGLQTLPYHGRIFAFKSNDIYTYAAGEGKYLYPSDIRSKLNNINRHMLMINNRYFIVYDDLDATVPTKFSWLYHVPEDRLNVTSNGSFTYIKSNTPAIQFAVPSFYPYRDWNYTKPNVKIIVSHIEDNSNLELVDLTNASRYINPITNVSYSMGQVVPSPTPDEQDRRVHAIWISNKENVTNWHFMTVIYPKNPNDEKAGLPDPRIERLDDFTAKVTSPNGTVDIITFSESSAVLYSANLLINLSDIEPLPVHDILSAPECNISDRIGCNINGYTGWKICGSDRRWGNCIANQSCGDGKINGYEQCDGLNINSTCIANNYTGGNLTCKSNCKFNFTMCLAPLCGESNWSSYLNPLVCPASGLQTRTWIKLGICSNGVQHPDSEIILCSFIGTTNVSTGGDPETGGNPGGGGSGGGGSGGGGASKGNVLNGTPVDNESYVPFGNDNDSNAGSSGEEENNSTNSSDSSLLNSLKKFFVKNWIWSVLVLAIIIVAVAIVFVVMRGRRGNDRNKTASNYAYSGKDNKIREIEKLLDEGERMFSLGNIAGARAKYAQIKKSYGSLDKADPTINSRIMAFYRNLSGR